MSDLINVSELIDDPDFNQSFTIKRSTGSYVDGEFVPTMTTLPFSGIVTDYNSSQVEYTPNGDIITGDKVFRTREQIFTTREADDEIGISDEIEHRGVLYKVSIVSPNPEYGFYKTIAQRLRLV